MMSGVATRGGIKLSVAAGGVAVAGLLLALPVPEGMSVAAWRTLAVGAIMVIWWLGEAIPLYATALLPMVLFPALGITDMKDAAAPYANPLIYLFFGGFVIGMAMQKWQLHKRLALHVLGLAGTSMTQLVAGFMGATAFISMWVSNTATAIVMLPIALSVLQMVEDRGGDAVRRSNFATALMLSIAYGANIGGMSTLIGTGPNALAAGYFSETFGYEIGFAQWMSAGIPVSVAMLGLAWLVLTKITLPLSNVPIPGAGEVIAEELHAMGPMSRGERLVLVVFVCTATLWVFRPWLDDLLPAINLTDTGIAVGAAVVLFLLPVDLKEGRFVMDWEGMRDLPWGILVLLGGGISFAAAVQSSGLGANIAGLLAGLADAPHILVIAAVAGLVIFLTEVTSNSATTSTMLPVLGALAISMGEHPLLMALPAVLAASCAFMLPVATPPNAIVFSSGRVSIGQMARAGVVLNLLGIVALTGLAYAVLGYAFGVETGVMPDWAHL